MKRNQKNVHRQLAALPWAKARAKFYDRTAAHGRLETRVVQALTISELGVDFPHAVQVAKTVRHRIQLAHREPGYPPSVAVTPAVVHEGGRMPRLTLPPAVIT